MGRINSVGRGRGKIRSRAKGDAKGQRDPLVVCLGMIFTLSHRLRKGMREEFGLELYVLIVLRNIWRNANEALPLRNWLCDCVQPLAYVWYDIEPYLRQMS